MILKIQLFLLQNQNVSGGFAPCHFCMLGHVSPKYSPTAGSVFRNALEFVSCCHDPTRFGLLQTVEKRNNSKVII